jgi:hypothetical protein
MGMTCTPLSWAGAGLDLQGNELADRDCFYRART